ncbi:MAG: low specificity L-threonine aldolase [Calditrichaceae bacterium]|nr:low specificity L-threonine aldolase [Calditrichaceae bacterium]
MMSTRGFASDNNAGVHPEILKAINECNDGHTVGYGDDPYTERAIQQFKDIFDQDADVYFVYGGTGANVLGLNAICRSHQAIFCCETAHIYVDECGAPEKFTGSKLIPLPSTDGKIHIEQIMPHLHSVGFPHHVQPGVISISQPTEYGTLYTVEEIQALSYFAHKNNMLLQMDGARLANAAAALDCNLKETSCDAGVDVLSFGGTKNGMMFGEAVIFFDPDLAENFKYIRKQGMQLHSKMRYISVQFSALLSNDLWKRNAAHANAMAKILVNELKQFTQIELTQPVETNAIFSIMPEAWIQPLQDEYFFYVWKEETNEIRWMTSFDTEESDIHNFIQSIHRLRDKTI